MCYLQISDGKNRIENQIFSVEINEMGPHDNYQVGDKIGCSDDISVGSRF